MNRHWCAIIQFPGKKPILYGNAHVDAKASMNEVEKELRAAISACVPDGWQLIKMLPGSLWYKEE